MGGVLAGRLLAPTSLHAGGVLFSTCQGFGIQLSQGLREAKQSPA